MPVTFALIPLVITLVASLMFTIWLVSFRPLADEKAIDPAEEERKKLIAAAMEELDEVDRLTGVLPPKPAPKKDMFDDTWTKAYVQQAMSTGASAPVAFQPNPNVMACGGGHQVWQPKDQANWQMWKQAEEKRAKAAAANKASRYLTANDLTVMSYDDYQRYLKLPTYRDYSAKCVTCQEHAKQGIERRHIHTAPMKK